MRHMRSSDLTTIRNLAGLAATLLLVLGYRQIEVGALGEIWKSPPPSKVEATPTAQPIAATSRPTTVAPLGQHSYSDRPDDFPGVYQIHVLYVVTRDFSYTVRDLDGSINEQVRLVGEWFSDQTDSTSLRFDTYQGAPDITLVVLPVTEGELYSFVLQEYGKYDSAFHGLVFLHNGLEHWLDVVDRGSPVFSPGKLYLTYFESSFAYVCGDGPVSGSRIIGVYPSAYNLRDKNDCLAFLGEGQDNRRGVWEHILTHEILHALGFPASCASNLGADAVHIDDPATPNDIMGSQLGIYDPNPVLDPNHDDYFMTDKGDCPDLSSSPFLSPLPADPTIPENVLTNPAWRLP